MTIVEKGSAEWRYMWDALGTHPLGGDCACHHAQYGEVWQYMGTGDMGAGVRHTFRHRVHPVTGKREYIHIRPSRRWAKGGAA